MKTWTHSRDVPELRMYTGEDQIQMVSPQVLETLVFALLDQNQTENKTALIKKM